MYIMQAIESSMNIVRDQLRQTIKDQLCKNSSKSKPLIQGS